ncbi:MAG TPA: hypothetical protein VEK08_04755 [Planctomycetota bacterium]|nr:hypothetical protein [Planctomycetota bacterium]
MAEEKKSGPTLNTRLAKAESLLLLALLMESVITPWILSQVHLQPIWKTLLKMLIVVGIFGPLFKQLATLIDSSLTVTRKLTTNTFSMPKMFTHAMIIAILFIGFYWSMHNSTPWRDYGFTGQTARAESRR